MFEAKLTLPLHLLLQAVETLTAQASRTSDIVVRTSCVPHLVALLSEVVDRRGILKAQKSYAPEAHICRSVSQLAGCWHAAAIISTPARMRWNRMLPLPTRMLLPSMPSQSHCLHHPESYPWRTAATAMTYHESCMLHIRPCGYR